MADPTPTLFVHGLWMTGVEGMLLRQRLSSYGLLLTTFRYDTTAETAADVVSRLAMVMRELGPEVPLLGHSLGGLLILRCLAANPDLAVGPVVLLGSPVNGSRSAQSLARLPGASWLMGEAATRELLAGGPRAWTRESPLGVIAGSVPFGLGAVIADLPLPHDGAVTVAETQLHGASAQRVFPVNHMGLLASAAVARAVAGFISSGQFSD